ncbi:MAG: NUDIX domain-containing protein [Actinomycetota bacterium]|nr:NUDIX domain-containing protein [Actinomycetota bacterium]
MTVPAEVPIRDAATVVLLRDGDGGIEAWLLTRVTEMAFAAGMTVFPGGRVEPADAELPFAGAAGADIAARFGCDEAFARGLLGAAVRETFEETGVLLTTPWAELAAARSDVEQGRTGFGDLLREHGLAIGAHALRPWARWITPPGETRRYDTHFFVGPMPEGAQAMDLTTESSAAAWLGVGDALEQAQRGERKLMPPTLATLASLLPFATVAEVVAAADRRRIEPIQPVITITDDGQVIADLPDGTSISMPRSTFR